ncbi:MAG: hypothetical protein FD127_319 [Acidimicrobiaceae bacterium]|nr:MAG: hypothetical protein FD127_319 [Acidimicrobiaceae bacterium]
MRARDGPRAGADRARAVNDVGPIVSTEIVEERGRFTVVLDVVFDDGAVRHRLQTYHTRARAELAARIVRAAAERDHGPDWGMQ